MEIPRRLSRPASGLRYFLDSVVRTSGRATIRWGTDSETDTLAMNLLLLLAVAVPLSCLGLLALLALLAVMTLGGVIHVVGTVKARRPQWPLGGEATDG